MSSIYSSSLVQVDPRAKNLMDIHPQDDGTDEDNLASSVLSHAPKLSVKTASFSDNLLRGDEIWSIRESQYGEEELYARGKCVYWTRKSIILRSFNFTDPVVKVFWSVFNKKVHICVVLTSGLSIFDTLGQHFQVPLPFAYQEIHSTTSGLIIERFCDPLDDSHLPTLFAMTHPTQEISPVLFKPLQPASKNPNISATSIANLRILYHAMPNFVSIIACHNTLPLCLTYSSQECQHSIWLVRRVVDEELDEYQRYNDESTIQTTFAPRQSTTNCSFRDQLSHNSPVSLNVSSKQRSSLLINSNHSSTGTINFSPKLDLRGRPSALGNLAASRLGVGGAQMTPETNATNVRSFNSTNTMNMMSTPNRNRMINFLRDNIEEPILPELLLEQVWIDQSTNSLSANKFFTYHDMVGDEYLVLVVPNATQLKIFRCDTTQLNSNLILNRCNFITALDAMPLKSMQMMIVIDNNRNILLYSGIIKITQVTVPQPQPNILRPLPTSSPTNLRGSTEMTPIHMSSARKRSSLGDRSIGGPDLSMLQLFQTVSPVPHKRNFKNALPIGLNDVKKIEYVIGNSVIVINQGYLRGRFTIPSICQTQCVNKLLNAMKILVSRDLGLDIIAKWYQTRRSSTQPELMSASDEMRLFKSWFLSSIGLAGNFFDQTIEQTSTSPDLSVKLAGQSPTRKARKTKESSESNPMLKAAYSLFFGMHLVFEDLLLMKLNYELACDLCELLLVLACLLKLPNYQTYYWLKFPHLQEQFGKLKDSFDNTIHSTIPKPVLFSNSPPSFIEFINKITQKARYPDFFQVSPLKPFPILDGVTDNLEVVLSLFSEMYGIKRKQALVCVSSSTDKYPTTNLLKLGPKRSRSSDEQVVVLMTQFKKTKNYLSRLPEAINLYLWDAILNCRESPPRDWSEACFNLIGRMDLVDLVCNRVRMLKPNSTSGSSMKEDEDEVLKLIFPDDIRVSEAHRMLASNLPVEFSLNPRQGATEDETRDETHRHLYLLNVRTMGMPVGRGAIGLRTYSPVIGESFEVPRLELSGRAPNEDRPIEFTHDMSVYPWPFFHNGVAAGLTICASTANNIIDSTWINYNRPRSNIPHGADMRERDLTASNINNEHAGFLFALGLNGHLEKLSLMALHDYLCQNNDLTKLAILLGMSAAKRGTRDNNIIKVLSIHVDALLPPNSTELDVPAPVHAASIIGVGLLYQGSGDSHISKVLLEEIGRSPGPEANSHVDRESYSLSAGLAFGLVNLCKGGSTTISSSDQLRLYMLGGKRKPLTIGQRERYFKQDCHRGEEEYINTHITSPGGTLGLGLMYHRSCNHSVANWMRAPNTQTLLEYVRPDCLILRMLSYGLIMWDEVLPSEEYVDGHVPDIVFAHAFQRNSEKDANSGSIDYELLSQAYCNIVAGCCMAIAMRYAGTGNRTAYNTIYKHTKFLITLNNKSAMAEQAGRPCIEACLNVLITSLSVLMAGTGDLGVLRVCRYLRSRLTQSCIFYGSYMAIHMALGILFLGSCRYSFSTAPDAIGALVCALYPIYPNHSADNRYHLQALRHLYVLAAEPRLIIPRDIETNRPVYVKITVRQRNDAGEPIDTRLRAPCMMPEVESVISVCVEDERYWRIEIYKKSDLIRCLYQEQGYLSVKQKAHLSNNQLVNAIGNFILNNMPIGDAKSRKQSALDECIKEDRLEQYSALNELLTRVSAVDIRFRCILFEQMRLASGLAEEDNPANKINLLKPIIDKFGDELSSEEVFDNWCKYASKTTDWTSTDVTVAHYVVLNDLKCANVDGELVKTIKDLIIH